MRFVRILMSSARAEPMAAMVQDTPFDRACVTFDVPCETFDLGIVDETKWVSIDGTPCSAAQYFVQRVEKHPLADTHPDAPKIRIKPEFAGDVNCAPGAPCTVAGIKQRLRERGPSGLPANVRAWLTAILPDDQVRALGIASGVPISTLIAAEMLRERRDPSGGSRVYVLQRKAQHRADAALARRTEQSRAAWQADQERKKQAREIPKQGKTNG